MHGYGAVKHCDNDASISLIFFKLKTAGVVLRSPKVYHFYGTRVDIFTTVDQST